MAGSNGDGVRPGGTAEKQLGEIVSDVTQKAQLLVREEVALAKAEIQLKVSKIVKGSLAFAAAGFFALLMIIFLLIALSYGFADWFGVKDWVGFGITTIGLLLVTAIAALVGMRLFKKGSPPTPDLAIAEAQRTRIALEEARH